MSVSERLSQGVEQLILEIDRHAASRAATEPLFDVVIVGSGYGGAVAAARLAGATEDGRPLRICVLERGREFVTGEFPERFADLLGHVRLGWHDDPAPKGRRDGLFDLRLGKTVGALLGNGLGGGSLINAGVLARPSRAALDRAPWPAELRDVARLEPYFERAHTMLGAAKIPGSKPAKLLALEAVAKALRPDAPVDCRAEVAVSFTGTVNAQGVGLNACLRCGDCFTGCNHGAKNTLPTNYLAAARIDGVRLFTGVTVLSLARAANGWQLQLAVTAAETAERIARKRTRGPEVPRSGDEVTHPQPIDLLARRVILAAGTFGSTEILLRSRQRGLGVSPRLGERFSTNGDMISVGYRMRGYVNASAKESDAPGQRDIGPTITGLIDLRDDARHPGIVIEEMAIPAALRRLFEETITTTGALHRLGGWDGSRHSAVETGQDVAAIDQEAVAQSAVYATMGDDGAQGVLKLVLPRSEGNGDGDAHAMPAPSDGAIAVDWPDVGRQPVFQRAMAALRAAHADEAVGGALIPYPLWQPLPDALLPFIDDLAGAGSVVTVHPLGGCAMADSAEHGVVNHLGQVFSGASGQDVHPGLVVLDGSIVPSALGINPCLTIAALAERSVAELVGVWGLRREATMVRRAARPVVAVLGVVPTLPAPARTRSARPTSVRLAERLAGPIALPQPGMARTPRQFDAALSIVYQPIEDLFAFTAAHPRHMGFEHAQLELSEFGKTVGAVEVAGNLSLLQREPSWPLQRIVRATCAWWRNRGRYEVWRAIADWVLGRGTGRTLSGLAQLPRMLVGLLKLNSHAGEARLFVYEMTLQADLAVDGTPLLRRGDRLVGRKRVAYVRGANLWQQLMNLELTLVGAEPAPVRRVGTLVVDLGWFAKEHAAQLQLVEQESQPDAIADVLSFFAYVVRVMVGIHLWSLRLPDYPEAANAAARAAGTAAGREPAFPYSPATAVIPRFAFFDVRSGVLVVTDSESAYTDALGHPPAGLSTCERRLPAPLAGLERERYALALPTRLPNVRAPFQAATMLLTRYRRGDGAPGTPVLLLHGYGAGGTTFALDSVACNLVQHLAGEGFDVWVADLRTSIGLHTSLREWVFEDVAYVDIPVALRFVLHETRQPALHVVAHCVGAATFSMACLSGLVIPSRVLSAVLSQVGPLVELPDMNRFRGYLASYLKHYLNWRLLSVTEPRRPFVELIDRILATYPFAKSRHPHGAEADAHLPAWPWQRVPHEAWCNRAAAIFGPLFSHANVNRATLDRLGELLGHVNFKTFQQTIFYATRGRITDHLGENAYVNHDALRHFFNFPVRLIHGSDNQVFAPAGSRRSAELLRAVFPSTVVGRHHISCIEIEGYGHQDCLIGANAHVDVYGKISEFLHQHATLEPREALERDADVLRAPRAGPILGWLRCDEPSAPGSGRIRARVMFVPDTRSSPPSHAIVLVLDGEGELIPGFARCHALRRVETPGLLPATTQQLPALRPLTATQALDVQLPGAAHACRLVVLTLHAEALLANDAQAGCAIPTLQGERLRSIAQAVADPHWRNVLPDEWAGHIQEACKGQLPDSAAADRRVADPAYERQSPLAHLSAHTLAAVAGAGTPASLAFAFGSCRYTANPLDREQADRSFGRLRDLVEAGAAERLRPQLLLLLGDQIYADATAGLFDAAADFDRFDGRYREAWTAPNAREVLRRLPTYMMLDDHEIRNDIELDPRTQRSALVAFESFQRCLAPANPLHDPRRERLAYWYTFEAGGCGFFVADTRTDRRRREDARCLRDRIIGPRQQRALRAWLQSQSEQRPDAPKFVVCPSVVLPLSQATRGASAYAVRSDAWDGFPASLLGLLDWIARQRIRRVVFLSGDFHCSLACEVQLKLEGRDEVTTVHSIVSSGLYAPFPFVNCRPEDLALRYQGTLAQWYGVSGSERFGSLLLDYDTRVVVTDDAFAVVGVRPDPGGNGGTQLEVEFDSRSGLTRTAFALH